MIPQSFIQDLLTRIDIVEVVGNRVQLKKAGANFWACCPFHSEKTPSFSVSPAKQFYHCFGCGRTGSAISFLMDYSGLTYPEAVEELARSIGVAVPHEGTALSKEERAQKQAKALALTEVMARADRFYRKELRKAPDAINYLKGRGLTGEIAARFGLGYAPDSWTPLQACFEHYNARELTESGLVIERSSGEGQVKDRRYDRFRGRIMFPIRNERGQVIAFGGRVLDKSEPKYLNSPETPLFSKGNELYGLFEARMAIREAGYALVVEGYMDVVALSQLGFPQAVATLGTACTEMHVRKLFRHTDRIVFSFDGDAAGRNAAKRAMESAIRLVNDEKQVSFLFLPSEHDPDSFIREKGAEAFEAMVQGAEPLSQFLMGEILGDADMGTMEGCAQALNRAKSWCGAMKPSALRLQVVRKLVELTGMPESDVLPWLGIAGRQGYGDTRQGKGFSRDGHRGYQQGRFPTRVERSAVTALDRQALRMLIRYPALLSTLTEVDVRAILASAADGGLLFRTVEAQIASLGAGNPGQVQYAALVEALRTTGLDVEPLIQETADDSFSEEMAGAQLRGAVRQMRMHQLSSEIDRLAGTIATDLDDREKYRELNRQLVELQKAEKQDNEQLWRQQDDEKA
ncbi:MAG: DNA primase [Oxalobacter sp.]|nr:DNA primase [Oxalobacter sp.]